MLQPANHLNAKTHDLILVLGNIPYPLAKDRRQIYIDLKFRGIKTRIGILEEESKKLNEIYIKYMKTKEPFVILKSATSLDGKI
ncbi:MAG: hypothetical protein KJ732_02690, partial [Candidatus Margulisbacteria bacterium]|nr:hypothetical protein [Candidatus Margulisiibacteriota bacterium]